jgi:multicomponent Na+:H+ antiporter subunit C
MMTGLYIVVVRGNLVKKIVGLNIFQTSVFMFYISIGKVTGGTAPIYPVNTQGKMQVDPSIVYSNPLPHVLILTAIVVGIATTSLALGLVIRIREVYDTLEEDDILIIERKLSAEDNKDHGPAMGGRA